MEAITKPLTDFVYSQDFFWYHGYGLTTLWILASTFAILFKKISVYLHAFCFFLIDVTTMLLVGGAIVRYLPKFASWTQWTLVRQMHVFGGIIVFALIILQHIGGVITLTKMHGKNKGHRFFGFVVTNLARVTVIVGWILGGNMQNMQYCAIATTVLFVAGLYNIYFVKSGQKIKQVKKKSS